MPRLNSYPNETSPSVNDEIVIDGTNGTRNLKLVDLATSLPGFLHGTANHKNIYRGKNLGSTFTDAQKAAIRDRTFYDLFIGDYWTINNIIWRIADINYWLSTGDTICQTAHLVIIPDGSLYNQSMNDTNTTEGGYMGSRMYKERLEQAKTIINNAFGSAYILNHREYLTNAVTDGHASGGLWVDSTVEIPNEIMIYGSQIFTAGNIGSPVPNLYTIDKAPLAIMRIYPILAHISRQNYWLRDIVSASGFACVNYSGNATYTGASDVLGVRPVFGLHG